MYVALLYVNLHAFFSPRRAKEGKRRNRKNTSSAINISQIVLLFSPPSPHRPMSFYVEFRTRRDSNIKCLLLFNRQFSTMHEATATTKLSEALWIAVQKRAISREKGKSKFSIWIHFGLLMLFALYLRLIKLKCFVCCVLCESRLRVFRALKWPEIYTI